MPITSYSRLILALGAVFLIPGWSFIAVTGLWRLWQPLQRWIIAIAGSLAFYPILYYSARFIFPNLHIGFYVNLVILAIGLVALIFALRKNWREQFAFHRWEVFAVLIVALTIFTRFWLIRDLPYPAWTDSLHHTLLTELTAEAGRLPTSLEPYSATSLDMYHLGLYAITGVVQQLSGSQAYTALLWTAQLLNGLCAIGIFFVLDRFVGRWAALTGIAVAGLVSFQPAWYVNWGRFTQLASQSILFVAFGVTWQVLKDISGGAARSSKLRAIGLVILAAGLNAAVFLLHFRVSVYYFPLLVIIVIIELISASKKHTIPNYLSMTLLVGGVSLILILPAVTPAIVNYFGPVYQQVLVAQGDTNFAYTSQTIFSIGIQPGLLAITLLLGVAALFSRYRQLAAVMWLWVLLLFVEGNLYKLGISFLNFSNFSGIIIGFYLPASILIGLGIEAILTRIPQTWQNRSANILIILLFVAGIIGGYYRTTGIEPWRYFMTDFDRQAMDWINHNTPAGSIFAINTFLWLGNYPHGTDGGYWIPYFTGRKTNTETMLLPITQPGQMKLIEGRSQSIVNYIYGNGDLKSLCDNNLDYIYTGKGNPLSKPFDTQALLANPLAKLVYQNPGVKIFQLCPGTAATPSNRLPFSH